MKPQIPVKAVRMHNDFHNKGFNHRFRHILSFVNVGITLQRILKDGQLFFVVGDGFGLYR